MPSFFLLPPSGPPGAGMRVEGEFDRPPTASDVTVVFGDMPLGEPTEAQQRLSIRRTVPDLPPGSYEVTLVVDGEALARSHFTIIEATPAGAASGPVLFLGLVTVALGVGWTASLRPWAPDRSALGAADALYAWMARRRSTRG